MISSDREFSGPFRKLGIEELNRLSVEEFKTAPKIPVTVILDNVRSLHNIGSIFRTCDAFRIESLFLCGISATPPHREIHKSALGAEDSVSWQYFPSAIEAVQYLKEKGYTLITVEQTENSKKLEDFVPVQNCSYGLVFGNEVRGVSQQIADQSDLALEIPQLGTKHSFNVSVTAGIVLWEFFKTMHTWEDT